MRNERSVKALENVELPEWVRSIQFTLRDKLNETQFLADILIFLSEMKHLKVSGKTVCEKEATPKACAKSKINTKR